VIRPATYWYALIVFSICLTIITRPSPLAAGGPCGLGGCLKNATNYVTNQNGTAGSITSITLPANVETQVASGSAGSYSANAWTYGVSGQVLLHNSGSAKTTFTLKIYIGDQAVCGGNLSCYGSTSFTNVTLRAGDHRWIPFTRAIANANTNDYYSFFVTVMPKAQLECESQVFYSTEHD
jgi:hypothetical protein